MEFYPYVFITAYLNRYSILFFILHYIHITLYIAYILKYIKKILLYYITLFIFKNLYNIFYWIEISEKKTNRIIFNIFKHFDPIIVYRKFYYQILNKLQKSTKISEFTIFRILSWNNLINYWKSILIPILYAAIF